MKLDELNKQQTYSEKEMEELKEWLFDLTIDQLFFMKDSLNEFYKIVAEGHGSDYVH